MYKVNFIAEGHPEQVTGQQASLLGGDATPDYFRTMGIPLLRGRIFNAGDSATNAAPVVIINNTLAERYWRDEDPIGHRIKLGDTNFSNPWLTIVGVVGDVRQDGLEKPVSLTAYSPNTGHAPTSPRGKLKSRGRQYRCAQRPAQCSRITAPIQCGTARWARHYGVTSFCHRNLRDDFLLGPTADCGDRNPHNARR
jgi:hypothetical protein